MSEGSDKTRILVVDDDIVDVRVILRMLEKCRFSTSVEYVSDLERVDALARSGEFDCLLLDYRFPTGTAFEVLGNLLAAPTSERASVVILTGMGDEEIAARSIQLGAEEYLSKANLSPNTLGRTIESALEKSTLQKELEKREQELVRMSLHDALTGLPNRRLFLDRLDQSIRQAKRADSKFALLMMDLNLFKHVNDAFGHDAGDSLLQQVAGRLQETVRNSDTVARLGGDEFAAILSTADSLEGAIFVAEKICSAVDRPVPIEDKVAQVGISIGVALYPDHGDNQHALIRNSDAAMYAAKITNSGFSVHDTHPGDKTHDPALIAQGIKGALENEELFLHYQPQVELSTGMVTGSEALVRWKHPQLGTLSPNRFIPVAERLQIIDSLTLYVLDKALAQNGPWQALNPNHTVSVNLSARLLDRTGLTQRIEEVIRKHGARAESLCLEVTETGIMHAPDRAEKTLNELSELGVKISIDDFGTGYCSLKYLRNFPIDEIKIDRLFVSGLGNKERDGLIVQSIIDLGSALGLNVVAEGIENSETENVLRNLQCRTGQGFHIAAPMEPLEFANWHNSWSGTGQFAKLRSSAV